MNKVAMKRWACVLLMVAFPWVLAVGYELGLGTAYMGALTTSLVILFVVVLALLLSSFWEDGT